MSVHVTTKDDCQPNRNVFHLNEYLATFRVGCIVPQPKRFRDVLIDVLPGPERRCHPGLRYPQLDTHRPMDQPNRGEGPELGWKTGQKESRNSPSAALVDNPKKFFATIR